MVHVTGSSRIGAVRSMMSSKLRDILKLLVLVVAALVVFEAAGRVLPWPDPAQAPILGPANVLLAAKRAQGNPFVLVLGDWVMGSSAMESAGVTDAYGKAIPLQFERMLKPISVDVTVANLAMDGALIGDYLGLLQLLTEHELRPAAAVVQVDYRLLSPLHDVEEHRNISRTWLMPYVAPWAGLLTPPGVRIAPAERPIDGMIGRWLLLRSDAYLRLRNLHASLLAAQPCRNCRCQSTEARRDAPHHRRPLLPERKRHHRGCDTVGIRRPDGSVAESGVRPWFVLRPPIRISSAISSICRSTHIMCMRSRTWFRHRYGATPFMRMVSLENIFLSSDFIDHCHLVPAANARAAKIMLDEFVLLNERQD